MSAVRLRKTKAAASVPQAFDGAAIDVVPMKRKHVRAVTAIENQIFPRPWSAALYYSELAQPGTRLYYVALVEGEVVGYAGAMLIVGEGHVTTVGVDPSWHRRGVGFSIFHRLVSDAVRAGAHSLTLEVRVSNTGAQALYHRFGFAPAGIRKNYYAEVNEDALVMWVNDVDKPEYAQRLKRLASELQDRLSRPGANGELS